MSRISIIAAVAHGGVIGAAGGIPWKHSPDMRRFRALTMGHPVIMGRKTWDSVGRPLPGRLNIVVTRNPYSTLSQGQQIAASLEHAINIAQSLHPDVEPFVIGGADLYRLALPLATRIELTKVHIDVAGDDVVRFPFDAWPWPSTKALVDGWTCEAEAAPEDNAVRADFFTYRKVFS
jgi:dihydrofolate reductase